MVTVARVPGNLLITEIWTEQQQRHSQRGFSIISRLFFLLCIIVSGLPISDANCFDIGIGWGQWWQWHKFREICSLVGNWNSTVDKYFAKEVQATGKLDCKISTSFHAFFCLCVYLAWLDICGTHCIGFDKCIMIHIWLMFGCFIDYNWWS